MMITMDKAGRVVLPKPIRTAARISPGTPLNIETQGGRIVIEPAPIEVRPERRGKRLVLVAPPDAPKITVDEIRKVIEDIRNERDADAWSKQT
ncbi:MAG: AbrB/MazE/SpoVT family DNA-binding domain-containing protein [Bryobacteraceae bacterium]